MRRAAVPWSRTCPTGFIIPLVPLGCNLWPVHHEERLGIGGSTVTGKRQGAENGPTDSLTVSPLRQQPSQNCF